MASCAKRVAPLAEDGEQVGHASWYGSDFHGRKTASGEVYDMNALTAAHPNAPFGTLVRVFSLENGRSTVVRINDRGPFVKGRIIDLSLAAAKELGLIAQGTAKVRLTMLGRRENTDRFYVQVGAFSEPDNARRMLTELTSRFPGTPAAIESSDGYHRVRVGPFGREGDAVGSVERLHSAGFAAFILRR